MNQNDIFKLLLILLLMSNENAYYQSTVTGDDASARQFCTLNDIILVTLLFNAFNAPAVTTTATAGTTYNTRTSF